MDFNHSIGNIYFSYLFSAMKELYVDSVRKSFGDKLVLSDIYLSCKKGEIIGLIGRNGSGKSTLLKIIFGVEKAENKFVRVNKKILKNVNDSRNLINYLSQENFIPGKLKIKNLINLFLPKKRRKELLEHKIIYPLLKKKFQNLSGGEKRITEILLLLNSECEFILLDEPFQGVSPIIRDLITENIHNQRTSKGIIITDHDYENVLKLADRILFLQDGALKPIRNKKELLECGYLTKTTYNTV